MLRWIRLGIRSFGCRLGELCFTAYTTDNGRSYALMSSPNMNTIEERCSDLTTAMIFCQNWWNALSDKDRMFAVMTEEQHMLLEQLEGEMPEAPTTMCLELRAAYAKLVVNLTRLIIKHLEAGATVEEFATDFVLMYQIALGGLCRIGVYGLNLTTTDKDEPKRYLEQWERT